MSERGITPDKSSAQTSPQSRESDSIGGVADTRYNHLGIMARAGTINSFRMRQAGRSGALGRPDALPGPRRRR